MDISRILSHFPAAPQGASATPPAEAEGHHSRRFDRLMQRLEAAGLPLDTAAETGSASAAPTAGPMTLGAAIAQWRAQQG